MVTPFKDRANHACYTSMAALLLLVPAIASADFKSDLAKATPGTVVAIPAGTFTGAVQVPAGVTLRGAGYGETILDGGNAPAVVTLKGPQARIENLTVQSKGTGIVVTADGAGVSRVAVRGGIIGVQIKGAGGVRVENSIVSRALIGLTASEVSDLAVANCTIYKADATGLSISNSQRSALLNNLVVDAGTAVVVAGSNQALAVDHNNYLALAVGKFGNQILRPTLPTWRDVSGGLDEHSVQQQVTFAGATTGDFHPVSTFGWNPALLTTANWGTGTLGGKAAPATDMDGRPRAGAPDVGAFEAPDTGVQPGDGKFIVSADEGVKSAGLFNSDNRLVTYLFQGLPLRRGEYSFVLPARDQFNRPLAPGRYELRLVEGNARWSYRAMTANLGAGNTPAASDSNHVTRVLALPDGDVLAASGWSERHINLVRTDATGRETRWQFEGSAENAGLALDGEGRVLLARNAGKDGAKSIDLYRLDAATGKPIAWPDGQLFVRLENKFSGQSLGGIAELGGKLFVADSQSNRVVFDQLSTLQFTNSVSVPEPLSPVADRKRNLVWLVSGRRNVLALDREGKTVHTFSAVQAPLAIAVSGDNLAIADAATGKIHLFDITNPAAPRPLKTLGRGDGPYGPWLPDRFHFQAHPLNAGRTASLSMNERGLVTLRDTSARIVTFAPDGAVVRSGMALWGNDPIIVRTPGEARWRVFDTRANVSYFIDPATGRWEPDTFWGLPSIPGLTQRGYFQAGGRVFGVFTTKNTAAKLPDTVHILSYAQPATREVLRYTPVGKGYQLQRDTSGDGQIGANDAPAQPVVDDGGKPVTFPLAARFMFVEADGTIIHTGAQLAVRWQLQGLDKNQLPEFTFTNRSLLVSRESAAPSVYDFEKTNNLNVASSAKSAADGGIFTTMLLKNTPFGTGLSNSGATDLARWAADGTLRWLRPMNDYNPIQNVEVVGDAILSSWGHQAEFMALDEDGLELGRFGFPAEANWGGYWVDHPQQWVAQRSGPDTAEVLVGDYMQNCHHWFTVRGLNGVKRSRVPVTVSEATTWRSAHRQAQPYRMISQSNPVEVMVKKLARPLPIDGDTQKWRALNLQPQILLTPQSSYGKIDGAQDLSGVARLAYHGQDLYGQLIIFDDVVSFHQPAARFYQADSLQFSINGFLTGFGFSIAKTSDKGTMFFRNRFFFNKLDADLAEERAPRVVKRFETAGDLPERAFIESIYGIDLSNSPGYIIEFKLPLDAETYKGDEKIVPPVGPGKSIWLGFMVNDNDSPGTDVQNYIAFPGTYGMFNAPEAGAKLVFE